MESEVVELLKNFSLSRIEHQDVELENTDVKIGAEEGRRSLIGRVFGDKKANYLGVKSSMLKLWQYKGLLKIVSLTHNTFQFVFAKDLDCEGIMQGRPWFFDNQLLILTPWT